MFGFAAAMILTGGAFGATFDGDGIRVSQQGRQFRPGSMRVKRGAMVRIVNDDGDLLHHAYVDSTSFSFDSGNQDPGSKTDVVFSVAGDFKVLCGIHPKMRMLVHVD